MKKHKFLSSAAVIALFAAFLFALPYFGKMPSVFIKDTRPNISSENAHTAALKSGDFVIFGSYLNEPILWRVADIDKNNRPLLISEYVLCMKAYDAAGKSEAHKGSDYEKCGSPVWETSTLNQWLNSNEDKVNWKYSEPSSENVNEGLRPYNDEPGFLNKKNFTDRQYSLIYNGKYRVFLPDKNTILKKLPKTAYNKKCTKAFVASDNTPYTAGLGGYIWYWTPKPANSNRVSLVVKTSGSDAFYKGLPFDSSIGVCPALYLTSSDLTVSGNGSIETPYCIS